MKYILTLNDETPLNKGPMQILPNTVEEEKTNMVATIKGAIFDMDGTLIDSLFVWQILWEEFGRKFLNGEKFAITKADDKAVRTMTLKDAMAYLHTVYHIGNDGEELLLEAEEILANFYANTVKLKDGVREFLEYCAREEIPMCIASATDMRLLSLALTHCDIAKYFTHILSCAETGKGKDDPDIYLRAAEALGTPIEETWVFEDSHVAIETAAGIGMKTVGIYDPNNFDHEKIERIATVYIADGETMRKMIP